MGILKRFLNAIYPLFRRVGLRSAKSAPGVAPMASTPRLGTTRAQLIGGGLAGGALGVATVYRCVELLSDSVANLPLQYMRLRDGIFVEDTGSRLHYLLTVQPDPAKSAFDFWKEAVTELLLDGNAYIVPVYNPATMQLDRLALCGRGTVSHDIYNDTYTVCDTVNGISGVFAEGEMIHLKGHTINGKQGVSVLSYARLTLDIASAGDGETLDRFVNGGGVRGLVSNDTGVRGFGESQDKELQKAATDIDSRFRSGERIVSLPGQVQFSPLSLSSTDMQFLETRKFTVREICRFFGVHPSFVFDDTSNNYKSAEMANVAFLSNTLNPLLRKIECELLRKLVAPSLCCKRRFQFDRRGLYACDLASRVKYQADTIAAGLYTVNEWRREENKPPVDGGDRVLVSANLRGVEEAALPAATPQDASASNDNKTYEDGK